MQPEEQCLLRYFPLSFPSLYLSLFFSSSLSYYASISAVVGKLTNKQQTWLAFCGCSVVACRLFASPCCCCCCSSSSCSCCCRSSVIGSVVTSIAPPYMPHELQVRPIFLWHFQRFQLSKLKSRNVEYPVCFCVYKKPQCPRYYIVCPFSPSLSPLASASFTLLAKLVSNSKQNRSWKFSAIHRAIL